MVLRENLMRLIWLGGHVWSSEDLPLPWEETPRVAHGTAGLSLELGLESQSQGAGSPSPCCWLLGAHGWVPGGRGEHWASRDRNAALVPRGAAVSASFCDGGLSI